MGCDIHIDAEYHNGKRWVTIPGPIRKCCSRSDCYRCGGKGTVRDEWYEGRHYTLFAALADVRNHGRHVVPIVAARGLPKDVSKKSKSAIDGGDHSHSWLGLDEIVDWPGWDQQKFIETIWVTAAGFKDRERALEHRAPAPYESEGRNWVDLTNVEMQTVVDSGVDLPRHRTEIETQLPLRMLCKSFFRQTVVPLSRLARKRGLEQSAIRLVFSFDS